MNKVTITAIATFGAGTVLGLSEAQAAPRAHALKKIGNGRYEVQTSVQFKAGEIIELEGDLPKAMGDVFVDEKQAAAKAKAEQKQRGVEAAKLRKQIEGEVYGELLALLPEGLRAQVEKAVTAAGETNQGK